MASEIIIYKAEEQAGGKTANCRSFLDMLFCKEIILQPGERISFSAGGVPQLLVLPIIGGVDIQQQDNSSFFIGAEQYFWAPQQECMWISNPYEHNAISCLIMGCTNKLTRHSPAKSGTLNLGRKNTLHSIIDFRSLKCSIGIFEGRKEATYARTALCNGLYCYIIRGVFEVQGRLLHPKDGLSFTSPQHIEFEALSNDAILLFIETT